MPFDAATEAIKIESLAHERLDASNDKAAVLNKSLTDEWASLSQTQRDQVAKALESKYSNHKWDTLPIPSSVTDGNGHCVALIFTASALDCHDGPLAIDLWTSTAAKGKEGAEISIRQSTDCAVFVRE